MASETGGGGRGGKKRYNSQPMESSNKDARQDRPSLEEPRSDMMNSQDTSGPSWSTVTTRERGRGGVQSANRFELLSQANSYPDRTMRSASITSRAGSTRSTRGRGTFYTQIQPNQSQNNRPDRPFDLGENTRFVTPRSEGALRDEITIECQTLNGRPFKGTLTFNEAVDSIFVEILGFSFDDLYSVRMRYSGCPIVKFKLKNQTNIDDLRSVEHFNLERRPSNTNEIDIICCKVLGIRGIQSVPHYDGSENDVRWVKIEGCEYLLTEDEIKQGLEPFGELLTPIREDICDDSDSERERKGNGTYSVKMKLTAPIPQFLPMHGRRIRIYHTGITKLCSNCYGRHTRRQCRNEKRQWIEYVRDFMLDNENLDENYYGKWWGIVDSEFPGYFEQRDQPEQEQVQAQANATRFAPPRGAPPHSQRDPRLNRPSRVQQQRQEPTGNEYPPLPPPTTQPDRQQEMSRLLASGLTLTDARKYLDNKAEQAEIERRMSNPNQRSSNDDTRQTFAPRGRGQQLARGSSLNRM